MAKLGVNIDHVATLREARRAYEPDPLEAARYCIEGGCDSIVCHLREDRRHIKESDVTLLRSKLRTRLNLEMSVAEPIVRYACRVRPDQATLVPEKRQEVTTEGGLDVRRYRNKVREVLARLRDKGIDVSLFIDPSIAQIDASLSCGARIIELHTGAYANAKRSLSKVAQLRKLRKAIKYANQAELEVNAGHGLNYENVVPVASVDGIHELNIGHSIVSRAVFVGIRKAVRQMKELVR